MNEYIERTVDADYEFSELGATIALLSISPNITLRATQLGWGKNKLSLILPEPFDFRTEKYSCTYKRS